jgi:hypothetical protein
MAGSSDMTIAAFKTALERHTITHKGAVWNDGTYYFAGTGWPVMGFGGHPQLNIGSRRHLLADLIRRKALHEQRAADVIKLKALQRGQRVALAGTNGEKHAIVTQPHGRDEASGRFGIEVSFNGVRRRWDLLNAMLPKAKWSGPRDLLHALEMERDKAAEVLQKCEAEVQAELQSHRDQICGAS